MNYKTQALQETITDVDTLIAVSLQKIEVLKEVKAGLQSKQEGVNTPSVVRDDNAAAPVRNLLIPFEEASKKPLVLTPGESRLEVFC